MPAEDRPPANEAAPPSEPPTTAAADEAAAAHEAAGAHEAAPPSEADERFAQRLADDLARILGTGIVLADLDLGPAEGPARISAVCLFDGRSEVLEAAGRTRLEAYQRLVRGAAELRLAIAARTMIAPV
jgi:hypothetical protein